MTRPHPTRADRVDELFDLLSDRYCRAVLAYLRDAEEDRTSIWDLATEIHDGSRRGKDPVVVQLRHSTIPRLADADAVDYSPNSGLVYYRGHDELERALDAVAGVHRTENGTTDSD